MFGTDSRREIRGSRHTSGATKIEIEIEIEQANLSSC